MLKGIDVSSHNGWPYNAVTERAYKESDFCIVKATQGTGYTYSKVHAAVARAKGDGKLVGVYHYAGNGNAVMEARHFWDVVGTYNRTVVPVLDFEKYQNESNWNDTLWAKRWCEEYHRLSGVWPMVYVQASAINRVSACAACCALWIAGYPTSKDIGWAYPRMSYPTAPWATWTLWQYTSAGGVDRDVAQLSREGWSKIAGGSGNTVQASDRNVQIGRMARDVINGRYGDGLARKKALGGDYQAVQAMVNELLGASSQRLADMVLQGRFGNGEDRRYILGGRYDEVQKVVNSR